MFLHLRLLSAQCDQSTDHDKYSSSCMARSISYCSFGFVLCGPIPLFIIRIVQTGRAICDVTAPASIPIKIQSRYNYNSRNEASPIPYFIR